MIAIIARGACSALGEGSAAFGVGRPGDAAVSCVAHDEELSAAGLARPFVARARASVPEGEDRATALLDRALSACARELDDALPGWRALRVGAAIGTSSGGMRAFERLVTPAASAPPVAPLAATYIGPLALARRPVALEPASLVLAACASSTIAIGLARAWLQDGACDVALSGGFDDVSVFVAAGFEALRATCGPRGPRPFRRDREGLALGEGAAVVALVGEELARRAKRAHAWVTGFGASCDAMHLTAPDPSGSGLARAAEAALAEAGAPRIGLVSAHGTATAHNDASEAAAVASVLGADAPVVFSSKGTIGHTLGAAGALEVLAAVEALERGVAPASVGDGPVERDLRVLDRAEPSSARAALKLSSAFGGANAALVVALDPGARPSAPRRRDVHLSAAVAARLEETELSRLAPRIRYAPDRIARADDLVRLAMAAVANLEAELGGPGSLAGAGILIGHGLATVETNARFWERVSSAGAKRAEPRRFPFTSPNAAAGECAVAFGLTGPAFAVGGGPHGGIEAVGVAADLVRARAAERIVVVAADAPGGEEARFAGAASGASAAPNPPMSAAGAVALLVGGDAARARLEACAVRLEARGVAPEALGCMAAHRALLPLVGGGTIGARAELSAEIPWGGRAHATLTWL